MQTRLSGNGGRRQGQGQAREGAPGAARAGEKRLGGDLIGLEPPPNRDPRSLPARFLREGTNAPTSDAVTAQNDMTAAMAQSKERLLGVGGHFEAQVRVGVPSRYATARGTLQEADLHQVRLVHIHDGVRFL